MSADPGFGGKPPDPLSPKLRMGEYNEPLRGKGWNKIVRYIKWLEFKVVALEHQRQVDRAKEGKYK